MSLPDLALGTVRLGTDAPAGLLRGKPAPGFSPAGNGIHHGRPLRAGDVGPSTITGLGVRRTAAIAPKEIR